MSLHERTDPRLGIRLGIIEPCLPSPAKAPPSGPGWIHEIKHDGFRILARRDPAGVQLGDGLRAGSRRSKRSKSETAVFGACAALAEFGAALRIQSSLTLPARRFPPPWSETTQGCRYLVSYSDTISVSLNYHRLRPV